MKHLVQIINYRYIQYHVLYFCQTVLTHAWDRFFRNTGRDRTQIQCCSLLVTTAFTFTSPTAIKPSHIQTHQLVNAVDGPVVLVTKSLHTLEAVRRTKHKIYTTILYIIKPYFSVQHLFYH